MKAHKLCKNNSYFVFRTKLMTLYVTKYAKQNYSSLPLEKNNVTCVQVYSDKITLQNVIS